MIDMPLLAKQLSREYNFSSQDDRDQAMRMGKELYDAGASDGNVSRKHTQDWYAAHYGKVEDWARKRLPEPWRTEYFHCVANGTWGDDDLGEPYMSRVGRIVPSGYFKMESAAEQLLRDQTTRAEQAEAQRDEFKQVAYRLEETIRLLRTESGEIGTKR
jgi:hypothetical protein